MIEEQKATKPTKLEKICLDNDCAEYWENLSGEIAQYTKDFVYCPFCSEELNLQCGACGEGLTSKDFKFCPWCGAEFEE
jgi:hypothetical protein